MDQVKR